MNLLFFRPQQQQQKASKEQQNSNIEEKVVQPEISSPEKTGEAVLRKTPLTKVETLEIRELKPYT